MTDKVDGAIVNIPCVSCGSDHSHLDEKEKEECGVMWREIPRGKSSSGWLALCFACDVYLQTECATPAVEEAKEYRDKFAKIGQALHDADIFKMFYP